MSTTVNVPTCNYSSYKLSSPYDTDLQLQFHSKLLSDFKNRDDNNNCSICQENMLELGYSSDLYNCSNCLGLSPQTTGYSGNYPILTQAWGCDTCATVVAPVSYYESSGTVAPPDKLELYLTDLTYKNKVDTMWFSASSCDKGTTIKNVCINPSISTFSINVPPQNQGPSNPQESASGLEPWMIALIVIASLIAVAGLVWYFWPYRAGGPYFKYVTNRSSNRKPLYDVIGPKITRDDIENEIRQGHLTREEGDFLLK